MNCEKPKKSEFWKNEKKIAGDIYHFTCVPKTTTIWGTVPEIWSETDFLVILGLFCTLTPSPPKNAENQNFEKLKKESGDVIILNLCNKKRNHMIYAYSDMKCDAHNFFAILGHFLLFYHTIDPEN